MELLKQKTSRVIKRSLGTYRYYSIKSRAFVVQIKDNVEFDFCDDLEIMYKLKIVLRNPQSANATYTYIFFI